MTEIYEDIDKLVLQFIRDEVDDGQISTKEIIIGCSHSGWKPKQVKESLAKQKAAGIVGQKSHNGRWYKIRV